MNCLQNPPRWSENRSVLLSVPYTGLAVISATPCHPSNLSPPTAGGASEDVVGSVKARH